MVKRLLIGFVTIAMFLLIYSDGLDPSLAQSVNTTNTDNLPTETQPVDPDTPVTIISDGKIVETNHADFMEHREKYLNGDF